MKHQRTSSKLGKPHCRLKTRTLAASPAIESRTTSFATCLSYTKMPFLSDPFKCRDRADKSGSEGKSSRASRESGSPNPVMGMVEVSSLELSKEWSNPRPRSDGSATVLLITRTGRRIVRLLGRNTTWKLPASSHHHKQTRCL